MWVGGGGGDHGDAKHKAGHMTAVFCPHCCVLSGVFGLFLLNFQLFINLLCIVFYIHSNC